MSKLFSVQGAVPSIQLAHAGPKASTDVPWRGGGFLREAEGGWQTLAPSPIPFREDETPPREMSQDDIGRVIAEFADAARRSLTVVVRAVKDGILSVVIALWQMREGTAVHRREPSASTGFR